MNTPTVKLVALSELTDLARKGRAMRRAQEAFFDLSRRGVIGRAREQALSQAKDAERRFDQAVAAALARERVPLPGLDAEGGDSCPR